MLRSIYAFVNFAPSASTLVHKCFKAPSLFTFIYRNVFIIITQPLQIKLFVTDEKYKKKIEGIIRKPQKTEEEPLLTPCPYCQNPTQESELHCDSCRNTLPYCIISGYHILSPDLSQCPHCQFPGIRSELLRIAKNNEICPMCSTELSGNLSFPELNPSQIKTIINATNGVEEDEEVNGEEVENDEQHPLSSANSSSSNATAGSTSRPASYRG